MKTAKHIDTEALSLITYRSAEGKLEEQIWNSQNGATPFVVYARDAETPLLRVDSQVGQSSASQPNIGDRIFVDATLENIIDRKRQIVESEWKNPEFQRIVVKSLKRKLGENPSPLLIARYLAECEFESYRSPGPKLIVVNESVLEQLRSERVGSAAQSVGNDSFHIVELPNSSITSSPSPVSAVVDLNVDRRFVA